MVDVLADPVITVYPRACGGTDSTLAKAGVVLGLSPRLRGNLEDSQGTHGGLRSIPAPAGEPSTARRTTSSRTVYPRACGGTSPTYGAVAPSGGLSPRPAEEPPTWRLMAPTRKVYPRACGGTGLLLVGCAGALGLSPRLRGNLSTAARWRPRSGSIPAPAGEPSLPRPRRHNQSVYPRACGGTMALLEQFVDNCGLSPRLRGNLLTVATMVFSPRSIPAPAGEPGNLALKPGAATVYPRACGGTAGLGCGS